ncbi:hypothetical protein RvY_06292 [Ramazzottius varieornatus]|uniref:Uncharacterized protein n=1 Tax=Ramazzottius varieornatus TaxID=947166 RepID=A0A1D1UY08_RAMVA|nr:hypothetical protein RvY_06292 [Ramazzottius varieornatus]
MDLFGSFASCILTLCSLWVGGGSGQISQLQSSNNDNANNCRPEFRRFGDEACLANILNLVNNESAFWFGRDLESRCDSSQLADINDANCYLPGANNGPRRYSILQRLFTVPPTLTKLDPYLTVTYATAAGNYTACGGDFFVARRGVDGNPDNPVTPWLIRDAPTFTLQVEPGKYYTIVTMDAVSGDVLGVVINYPIPEEVSGYRPPYNARNYTVPVVFLVYRQPSGNMQISSRWINAMSNRGSGNQFDLASFAQDQQLTGPISMNLMRVDKDPWAAQQKIETGQGPNFCAYIVREALKKWPFEFIQNMDSTSMDSFLTVTFSSPASSFSVCCADFTYRDSSLKANPLNDAYVGAIHVRDQPSIRVTRANGVGTDRLYTIIGVDPTNPKNALSTPERPYLLWLAINIREADGGLVQAVNTVLTYAPTIPAPQSPPHTLFFFLYEQTKGPISEAQSIDLQQRYTDPLCADYVLGRCLFRIANFTADYNMTLRAASWVTTVNDAFARYWMIKSGQLEWDICTGQPDYRIPCLRPGQLAIARVTDVSPACRLSASFVGKFFVMHILTTSIALWRASYSSI